VNEVNWQRLCVCASVSRKPVNQTVGELNANSSKEVKATNLKFDTRFQDQYGYDFLKFIENPTTYVTSEIFGR